jgi:hypothetical protein
MDQSTLVKEAQVLTMALDGTKIAPRAVMITIPSDSNHWKIWIVPGSENFNKQEFYRIIAEVIARNDLKNIDMGSVELRPSTSLGIVGLSKLLHMEGVGSVNISSNAYEGMLLPDGIVIRMAV